MWYRWNPAFTSSKTHSHSSTVNRPYSNGNLLLSCTRRVHSVAFPGFFKMSLCKAKVQSLLVYSLRDNNELGRGGLYQRTFYGFRNKAQVLTCAIPECVTSDLIFSAKCERVNGVLTGHNIECVWLSGLRQVEDVK